MQARLQVSSRAALGRTAGRVQAVSRRALVTKAQIKVGDVLPDFEVETDTGAKISSKDIVKDTGAVIFFYPRANTSGCTNQACGFRDNIATFESAGYRIFGMSADKPADQAAWKQQYNYPYTLLCDPSFEVLIKLGVTKENNTKVNRSHIVVDKGGLVRDVKIGIAATESVPEALKTIAAAVQL